MARQTKTERQRAEEALAVARRKVDRLTKDRDRLEGDLRKVKAELRDAARLAEYRAQHPALPAQLQPDTNTEENPTT